MKEFKYVPVETDTLERREDHVLPLQLNDLLSRIARESARMSWPGQMHPTLHAKTKDAVQNYFAKSFLPHLETVWVNPAGLIQSGYDAWHEQRARDLGYLLKEGNHVKVLDRARVSTNYNAVAVACKLLNTFMHQLMKYQACRHLYQNLHLVLDKRVFDRLCALRTHYRSLQSIIKHIRLNPYKIGYTEYMDVQKQLWPFIDELNRRQGVGYQISSRIELNSVLWA